MCRTRERHPNPGNLALYLRTRAGLSQAHVARRIQLSPIDLSRFERGNQGILTGKAVRIARFYGLSLDDLVHDNYAAVLPKLPPIPARDPAVKARFRRRQLQHLDIGDAGEAFVAALEREKLRGTPYENGVNEAYADDPNAGFDLMSFTPDGIPRYLEVKTTTGDENEPFYMSEGEFSFMMYCLENGLRYELHRVYRINDPKRAGVRIYTAQELMKTFDFLGHSYLVRRHA